MDIDNHNLKSININLKEISFLYKLWLLVNSDHNSINWCSSGLRLCINIEELKSYLNDKTKNIFKCSTASEFFLILNTGGFERYNENKNSKFIYYGNLDFRRNRFDLLQKLKKKICSTNHDCSQINQSKICMKCNGNSLRNNKRIIDSTCKKVIKYDEAIQKRLLLSTMLKKERCCDILEEQTSSYNTTSIIPIPAEIFKSPSESVSGFEENFKCAGFYGSNVTLDELQNTFGKYLPIYMEPNIDVNVYSRPSHIMQTKNSNLQEQYRESQASSLINETDTEIVYSIPTDNIDRMTPLEPIYYTQSRDCDEDDDISMDECIKFNNKSSTSIEENKNLDGNSNNNDNYNLELSSNYDSNTVELEDHSFRSFLHQYANSMNILLEE